MRITFLIFTFLFLQFSLSAQAKQSYRVGAIGFYNFENLFDTEDDPKITKQTAEAPVSEEKKESSGKAD